MDNYFIINRETGKLELHFDKSTYMGLDDSEKATIKSNFLWGRKSGCWISRAKVPNLSSAQRVAESLGLENAGSTGERLSFAEQMERKQERAERRAGRYEARADAAEKRGETLQAPINSMHGDIAFFTQPNINTSAGRAFTRRRERMFAAFDRGVQEFQKSEYWRERAAAALPAGRRRERRPGCRCCCPAAAGRRPGRRDRLRPAPGSAAAAGGDPAPAAVDHPPRRSSCRRGPRPAAGVPPALQQAPHQAPRRRRICFI